jgi:hypothetical protein
MERIKEVNEIYKEQSGKGINNEYIYKHFIKDKYHISRTTFYSYLTVPYKKYREPEPKPDAEIMRFRQLDIFE